MSFKINRLTEDIKRELSDIMHMLKDPRIQGLISITKVNLTNDLSYCNVYVSSLDGEEAGKRAAEGLNSAAGFICREIASRVDMRKLPKFKFIADDSIEYSARISQKLDSLNIKKEDEE